MDKLVICSFNVCSEQAAGYNCPNIKYKGTHAIHQLRPEDEILTRQRHALLLETIIELLKTSDILALQEATVRFLSFLETKLLNYIISFSDNGTSFIYNHEKLMAKGFSCNIQPTDFKLPKLLSKFSILKVKKGAKKLQIANVHLPYGLHDRSLAINKLISPACVILGDFNSDIRECITPNINYLESEKSSYSRFTFDYSTGKFVRKSDSDSYEKTDHLLYKGCAITNWSQHPSNFYTSRYETPYKTVPGTIFATEPNFKQWASDHAARIYFVEF